MADERLLNGVRRYWDQSRVEAAYQTILNAYMTRLERVTVIVGKSNEGASASSQVVVAAEDYKEWMEVLEARLKELENAESGTSGPPGGVTSLVHSGRYSEP